MPLNEPEEVRPNRRILIVDDNPSIHEDYRRILESRADEDAWTKMRATFFGNEQSSSMVIPFELDFAFQGEQACAKVSNAVLEHRPYALAFIDVRMPPGMDGVETLQKLWEIDPKLQAVICSAYSDYSLEDLHTRLDCADNMLLLKKPFEAIVVKQIAEALCRKWSLNDANLRSVSKLKHAYSELSKKITERDELQQQLDLALRCSQIGAWHWDPARERIQWDNGMSELFGFPLRLQQSTLAEFCDYFKDEDALTRFESRLQECQSPQHYFELELQRKVPEDQELILYFKGSFTQTQLGPRVAGVCWDITQPKKLQEELRYLSHTDPLTDFANRQHFVDVVERTLNQLKENKISDDFMIMFIDLDEFKNINDSRGHLFGDKLLRLIAQRLRQICPSGHLLARLGGDEFALLIRQNAAEKEVTLFADQLLEAIRQPIRIEQENFYFTASIGIVQSHSRYHNAMEMLRDADNAMYRAKMSGKDKYMLFDSGMLDQARRRVNMENNLRSSIQSRELLLHFQPIAALQTQSIEGYEALLRWQPEQEKLISPAEFIPIAEESGMIHEIGMWVLRQACLWINSAPAPAYISVNLSPIQIYQPHLVDTVAAILEQTELDPTRLRLEITENAIITHPARAVRTLNSLRDLGARIWLDDFGTGYSSLSYLNSLPLHGFKVDRSFVSAMNSSEQDYNLTRTIVRLGQDLGMSVVAEGIETQEQLESLKDMNCELGQGYFLGKPAPLDSPQPMTPN